MLEDNATTTARLPVEVYQKLMALWGRLTIKPMKASLVGAAVAFAMADEPAFIAYLNSVEPAEAENKS